MRTLTSTPASRRRASRGAGCDDMPRLWGGDATEAPAPQATAPVAPAPQALAPAAPPAATATIAAPAEAPAAAATVAAPQARLVDGPSLEDLICGAWDDLGSGTSVACPVCASEMAPRWSAGAGVVGGRCGSCGTTIE